MKLTRRQLPAALASAAALTSAVAQAPAPAPPASAEAELQSARDQVKAIALMLTEKQVPMATEPAFAFHA